MPPSFWNAGLSLASVSALVSFRGRLVGGDRGRARPCPGTCTGTISALNFPASIAATAFRWLS